jgi:hypothetical protein
MGAMMQAAIARLAPLLPLAPDRALALAERILAAHLAKGRSLPQAEAIAAKAAQLARAIMQAGPPA